MAISASRCSAHTVAHSTLETGALRANGRGRSHLQRCQTRRGCRGNKGSPVLGWRSPAVSASPLSSLQQHKGCAGRQERIAGAGLCQASQLPPSLTNNPPSSPVSGAGERKGRKRESPAPLPAQCVDPGAPRQTPADAPSGEQRFLVLLSSRQPRKTRWSHPNPPGSEHPRQRGGWEKGLLLMAGAPSPDQPGAAAGVGCFGTPGASSSSANASRRL